MSEQRRNGGEEGPGRHQNPLPGEIRSNERRAAEEAHRQADKDIEADAELSAHSPNDDLDEGESARLGENTDIF